MTIILTAVLLLTAVVLHEIGHAMAMLHRGVEIEEMGLGLPIGNWRRRIWMSKKYGISVVVTPLLIGAYVQPSRAGQRQLDRLGYRDQAACYGAGIIVNIIFASALATMLYIYRALTVDHYLGHYMVSGAVWAGIGLAFVLLRRWVAYAMPLLSVGTLILLIGMMAQSLNNVGGPASVINTVASAGSLENALVTGAALSLSLALLNVLPLMPFDGGRVMHALLRSWRVIRLAEIYVVATMIVTLTFLVFVVAKDFV